MIRRFLNSLVLTAVAFVIPATVRAETIAIVNAHILTAGPVGEVPQGTVVMRDGKIMAAGASISVPDNARIIDAKGGRVTSGLIATDTALGLMEVSSVQGTVDGRTKNSEISAAFDVQYGLNADSTLVPIARLGGVTRAVTMPGYDDGNEERELPFAGQAALISLGEGSSILFKPKLGMVLEIGERGGERAGGSRAAEFVQLRIIFDNVHLYRSRKFAYDKDKTKLSPADLEALVPVVEGRMPLIVSVHRAADIRQVLKLARDYRLKIILDGAEEAWRIAPEIAAASVPVLLNPTSNIPSNFEMLGATLRNARLLDAAGVEIAFSGNDAGHRVRDMRYNAGVAVSRGLPYGAALKAITLGPARIFGVDDQLGSIAPGKIADLVIWNGDPLEPLTQPIAIFIEGREQPMTSRALDLRDRYLGTP